MISVFKMFREPPKIWNPYLQRNDINPEFALLVTPAFEMLKFSNAKSRNAEFVDEAKSEEQHLKVLKWLSNENLKSSFH